MSKPWLQRPGETEKAYRAFEAYLEERDYTQVDAYCGYCEWRYSRGEAEERQKKARARATAPGYISEWATEHDWERRRRAFYRQVDEEAFDALMESKKRRKVERIQLLDEVQEVLEEELVEVLRRLLGAGEEEELNVSVKELAMLLDKLNKNFRAELDDLPTQEHDVADGSEIAAMLGLDLGDGG